MGPPSLGSLFLYTLKLVLDGQLFGGASHPPLIVFPLSASSGATGPCWAGLGLGVGVSRVVLRAARDKGRLSEARPDPGSCFPDAGSTLIHADSAPRLRPRRPGG